MIQCTGETASVATMSGDCSSRGVDVFDTTATRNGTAPKRSPSSLGISTRHEHVKGDRDPVLPS